MPKKESQKLLNKTGLVYGKKGKQYTVKVLSPFKSSSTKKKGRY